MYSYGTSVLFVCRLCKSSFQIVDNFIGHKKEEHSVEFRTSNCIVFEDILILNTCNDEGRSSTLSTVKEKGNPVTSTGSTSDAPLVGIENNLTDVDFSLSTQNIQRDPADSFHPFHTSTSDYKNDDTHENFSYVELENEISDNSLQPNHDDYKVFYLPQPQPQASAVVSFNFTELKTELTEFGSDQKIKRTPSVPLTQGPQNPYVLLKKLGSKKIEKYSRPQNQQDTVQAAAQVTSESLCKLCLKKFNSEAELEIHSSRVCILDDNKRDRYCFRCKKLFNSKWARNIHRIKLHGTDEEKRKLCKFKCNLCQKAYFKKESLTNHMESHKEPNARKKPFKCDKCSSSFIAKHHLRRHEAGHARSFQCTEPGCEKAFKRGDHLKKHLQFLHSNILELFKCPEPNCTSIFKRKETLRRHLRLYHTTNGIL